MTIMEVIAMVLRFAVLFNCGLCLLCAVILVVIYRARGQGPDAPRARLLAHTTGAFLLIVASVGMTMLDFLLSRPPPPIRWFVSPMLLIGFLWMNHGIIRLTLFEIKAMKTNGALH